MEDETSTATVSEAPVIEFFSGAIRMQFKKKDFQKVKDILQGRIV